MAGVAYPSTLETTWQTISSEPLPLSRARAKVVAVTLATVLALAFRVVGLSTYGLSEDEINKARAIEQYRSGHFTANAEHPMLMKLAMWGSLEVAGVWNRLAPSGQTLPIESAIRLPNAVAGAATTVVLFGVADLLFGTTVAMVASLLWAFDVNAIAINRIGKEDTFLLLFFLLAVWCYERAKRLGITDSERAQRWYTSSGASFGLMLASKYMPHYLGIYALFNVITDRHPGSNRPDRRRYYATMLLTLVAANLTILMPATWRYCASYVQGGMLAHHGYLYAGRLYITNIPVSPLGVPASYYLRLLATKVPLAVLGGTVAGVIELVRRRHERGFVLLRVLFVFLLVPYSLMAAKFIRYTLPVLALIDLTAAVGFVSGIGWLLRKSWLSQATRLAVSSAVVVVSSVGLVVAQQAAAPFYSLFQNAVGERLAAPGVTFPEETYDYGVREAVAAIAATAEKSAFIVSDAPAVVAYYLERSSRADLRVRSLSGQGISYGAKESWVIVQDEHSTFENARVVDHLRQRATPWREFYARDTLAAQVFRIAGR
jgi:hypothetical protein